MSTEDLNRFRDLTFEGFRELAQDASLSPYEKIGFPNSYREGKEGAIFHDIRSKLGNLSRRRQTVVDIGPGCSNLPRMLIGSCREMEHEIVLVDSPEMLALLPDEPFVRKVAGRFPAGCASLLGDLAGRVDVLLSYSVLHYVFPQGSVFQFLDAALSLLAPGGEMLIGDIPNISKRKRFFSSAAGIQYHQQFTGQQEAPAVSFNQAEPGQIDDAVMASIVLRSRASGFDAYWMPQSGELPMANRREDILIRRP